MMHRNTQQGMTLVELMIALGLGIFLIAGLLQIYLGGSITVSATNAQAQMQENARFGLYFIGRALRDAGYRTEISVNEIQDENIRLENYPTATAFGGADFELGAVVAGTNGLTGVTGAKTSTDMINLRVQGSEDGVSTDCLGVALQADAQTVMSFYVSDATIGELRCRVVSPSGISDSALVEGVDDLQLLYGVNTDPSRPGEIGKYVNASQVGAGEWASVTAVKIALLASSQDAPLKDSSLSYSLLDQAAVAYTDGKARRQFAQTVALRNQAF